uniref:Uncharacterized protein n=1 Tax=Arundo donax TaxID=35708 RepID=A0A0A9E714_ARUDO
MFPGSHRPQWSSTVLIVANEKKNMPVLGVMPEMRNESAPPMVSRMSPSRGWL